MAGTVVKIKQSAVAGKIPLSSDLQQGELALNTADIKLYSKNASGAIITLASGADQFEQTFDMGDANGNVILDGGDSNDAIFVTHEYENKNRRTKIGTAVFWGSPCKLPGDPLKRAVPCLRKTLKALFLDALNPNM